MANPTARRQRLTALPPVARARKTSKEDEVRKVFEEIDRNGGGQLSRDDLRSYMCDYLGFGQAEAAAIFSAADAATSTVDFESFRKNYASLNPFSLIDRRKEVIIRKPGSLCGQMITLDGLEDCEVYICDITAQVMMDYCKRCTVMFGPCESSVFVRNCEDCNLWLAVQQLRTRDCQRCTFHMYAKTEPIIETSTDIAFAPWAARYPQCCEQFAKVRFDPGKNFWNAIFDFNPAASGSSNWRILSLLEVCELVIELNDEPGATVPPNSPLDPITYEQLCAKPCASGESAGASVANIVQVRPPLPPAAPDGTVVRIRTVKDPDAGAEAAGQNAEASPEAPIGASGGVTSIGTVPDDVVQLKVGASKGVGFYARAAENFLCGVTSNEGKDSRPPVHEVCISGLGNAVGVAAAVAARLESNAIGRIVKVQTLIQEMPNGRTCPQLSITVRRIGQ